jgi:hypothetical protein
MTSIYFYPGDFISDTAAVIKQARNVLPADFTTENVESFEYQAYSFIRTLLNKDDWAPTDREFGAIQRINVDLAVAYIRKHYGKGDVYEQGRTGELSCIEQLKIISDNLDTVTGEEAFTIARTPKKSWNLNPDVPVPRGNLTIS